MTAMRLRDIDPRLRATALLPSIRHIDRPLIREVMRAAQPIQHDGSYVAKPFGHTRHVDGLDVLALRCR